MRKGDIGCLSRVFVHRLRNQMTVEVIEEICLVFGPLFMAGSLDLFLKLLCTD